MIRTKKCVLCDNKVFFDTKKRKLKDGYSWGRVYVPTKDAKKIYEKKEFVKGLGDITVVDYDKHESFEYIECLDCYNNIKK